MAQSHLEGLLSHSKPCPICHLPMGLVRVLQLDSPYEVGLFKCEPCKCEICMQVKTRKTQDESVKNQDGPSIITAPVKDTPREEATELTHKWGRATPAVVGAPAVGTIPASTE